MTKSDNNGLSSKQKKALSFFLSGRSEGECCRHAQISRETYYQWLKDPSFRIALSDMRNAIVEDAVEILKIQSVKAVNTLIKLLDVDNPVLQRHVANDILGHVIKFKEIHDIENRLAILESK